MFHVYTFGKESRQFLILTKKQAHIINSFTDRFAEAQDRFLELYGYRWTPDEKLQFDIPDNGQSPINAYNELVPFCNRQHKVRNAIFDLLRIDTSKEKLDNYLTKRF